jgi:hypothetical protein
MSLKQAHKEISERDAIIGEHNNRINALRTKV